MEKVTLRLFEFYNLEGEIGGITNQQTGEILVKGLINEKIKLTTKYWLTDLLKKVIEERKSLDKIREELIKKYGESTEDGNYSIPSEIEFDGSTIANPKFFQFQNEFNSLLEEKKDLEYKPFSLEDFDNVETDGNYPTLFKLIKVEE